MSRYVVLVKPPDDHPAWIRVMGTFRDEEKANELCERIRAECEEQFEDLDAESPGYAYVIRVERPRIRSAIKWATRGEEAGARV